MQGTKQRKKIILLNEFSRCFGKKLNGRSREWGDEGKARARERMEKLEAVVFDIFQWRKKKAVMYEKGQKKW